MLHGLHIIILVTTILWIANTRHYLVTTGGGKESHKELDLETAGPKHVDYDLGNKSDEEYSSSEYDSYHGKLISICTLCPDLSCRGCSEEEKEKVQKSIQKWRHSW